MPSSAWKKITHHAIPPYMHFPPFRVAHRSLYSVGHTPEHKVGLGKQLGRDKSDTKVKKDGILESPKMEVFRKFYSKRGSFERWRRAILLQEPGEFFYPSFVGDLLSAEHKTSTKTQFLLDNFGVGFWRLQNNEKKPFLSLWEEPQSPKSGETEEKYGLSNLFRLQFSCEARLNLPCFFQRENCSPKTPT